MNSGEFQQLCGVVQNAPTTGSCNRHSIFSPPPLRPRGRRTTSPWECDACDKTFGSRSSAFSCARCGYDVCPACRGAVDASSPPPPPALLRAEVPWEKVEVVAHQRDAPHPFAVQTLWAEQRAGDDGSTNRKSAPASAVGLIAWWDRAGECSFMYRYILRESCSQFDSLPLTSLMIVTIEELVVQRHAVDARDHRVGVPPRRCAAAPPAKRAARRQRAVGRKWVTRRALAIAPPGGGVNARADRPRWKGVPRRDY